MYSDRTYNIYKFLFIPYTIFFAVNPCVSHCHQSMGWSFWALAFRIRFWPSSISLGTLQSIT